MQAFINASRNSLITLKFSIHAQLVKNLPTMLETWVWSLGWEDPPGEGKGYPLQYSGLENSMDCIVHGVTKSRTRLSDFHFLEHHCKLQDKVGCILLRWWKTGRGGTRHIHKERKKGNIFNEALITHSEGPCWNLGHLPNYVQCTQGIY